MADVSLFRLYLLRAVYLLVGAGLLVQVWLRILLPRPGRTWFERYLRAPSDRWRGPAAADRVQ